MQNFRKVAQLEIPKNRGELYNDGIISKIKKLRKYRTFFRNKKPKIWIPGKFIWKAHGRFQEASSIGNNQKSRGTIQ